MHPHALGAARDRGAHATGAPAATRVPSRSDRTSCRSAASASGSSSRTSRSSRDGRKKSRPSRSVMTLAKEPRLHRRSSASHLGILPAAAPGRLRTPSSSVGSRLVRTASPTTQAPRPPAGWACPRGRDRSLPCCAAQTVGLVRPSPRLATLRPTPIRSPRLPTRPRPCRSDAARRAVPLLGSSRLEPALAALEQATSSPWAAPRTSRLRPEPIRSIVPWAHGRLCSRRTKSRERVPALSRGDFPRGRAVRLPRLHDHHQRPPPHPGPPLAATSTSRPGPLRRCESGPVPRRHLHLEQPLDTFPRDETHMTSSPLRAGRRTRRSSAVPLRT